MEKINVNEFIEKYEACKTNTAKEKMIKDVVSTDYVEFNNKAIVADRIVKASCLDDDGNIVVNSVGKHLLRVQSLLQLYTFLDINSEEMLEIYDTLMENKVLMLIIAAIPEQEIVEMDRIIEMTFNDFMTNHYEIHGFITSCLNDIGKILEKSLPQILDIINSSDMKE